MNHSDHHLRIKMCYIKKEDFVKQTLWQYVSGYVFFLNVFSPPKYHIHIIRMLDAVCQAAADWLSNTIKLIKESNLRISVTL